MLCRSCGKESRNPQWCEWCRQPMNAAAPPTPNAPQYPPQNPPGQNAPSGKRVSLTGEVYDDVPATPPAPPPMYANRTGDFAPTLPAGVYTPQSFPSEYADDLPSWGERFERFLAMALPALAVCILVVRYAPASFLWVVLTACLVLTLMLSGAGVVPQLGEEGREAMIILLVSFLFGPLFALVVYGILCLLRQEGSGGIAAILATPVIVTKFLALTFVHSADVGVFLSVFTLFGFMAFLPVCAAFVGWLIGGMFRPIGE